MATPEKEVVSVEVKTETKKAQKDIKSLAGEIEFMGVSLTSVQAGFKTIAATARASFATIKAAIASTGIGLFVVAIGSLISYFRSSEEAGLGFTKIVNGLKAAFDNALDVVQDFGGAIAKLVSGDWKGFKNALGDAFDGLKNIGEQTREDIKATNALAEAQLKLTKAERKNVVDRARNQKEISKLRLQARDEQKFTDEERLAFVQRANELSENQLKTDLRLAKERLRINLEENEVKGDLQKEELDRTAQLKADIINLENRNFTELRRLKSEEVMLINKINTQIANDEKERIASEMLDLKAFTDFKLERIKGETDEELKIRIAAAQKLADEEKKITKATEDFKEKAISQGFGALAAATAESSDLSKTVAVAQTIYNTQQGIMAALAATSVQDKLLPQSLRFANAIAVGVMGAASVAKILSTSPTGKGGGGGGGGSAASMGGGFKLPSEAKFGFTPAAQMMSGAFSLTGGEEPEAMKAFVVTDEMTNSQNQLANIRRRATI